jgi:hypothetical protein
VATVPETVRVSNEMSKAKHSTIYEEKDDLIGAQTKNNHHLTASVDAKGSSKNVLFSHEAN